MFPGAEPAPSHEELIRQVDALVDECRAECLWYPRRGYHPRTDLERFQVLDAIQEHTDADRFRRAGRLKRWLSPRWRAAIAGARELVRLLPSDEVGKRVLAPDGTALSAAPSELAGELAAGRVRLHEGRIGGAFPELRDPS